MHNSSKKKVLLLIVPAFFENRPQSIRFRNIVRYYKPEKEVQLIVIFPGNKTKKYNFIENKDVLIYEYKGSRLGTYLNRYYYPKDNYQFSFLLQKLRKYVRFLSKYFLYPDRFVLEINNLKKVINKVALDYQVAGLVLSAAPHSVLCLSKFIKEKFKNENVTVSLDVGDPLYNNASKKHKLTHNVYAKFFETKYFVFLDKLIVTNIETKAHYLRTYPKLLSSQTIAVVPMGGELSVKSSSKVILQKKKSYKIIYAGIFYKKLRNPDAVFQAVEQFNKTHQKSFYLDIYGAGMEYYESRMTESMKKHIKFMGVTTNENIYKEYENYDLVLHIDNAFGLQTPGKNFELLLSNMPILFISSNRGSSSNLLFKDLLGVFSSENVMDEIIKQLEKITLGGTYVRPKDELIKHSWKSRSNLFFENLGDSL